MEHDDDDDNDDEEEAPIGSDRIRVQALFE